MKIEFLQIQLDSEGLPGSLGKSNSEDISLEGFLKVADIEGAAKSRKGFNTVIPSKEMIPTQFPRKH